MSLDAIDSLPPEAILGVASAGMLALAHLPLFFGARRIVAAPRFFGAAPPVSAWLGWGARRSGLDARRRAQAQGLPFAVLEDGFIRSVGLGKTGAPPVSLVADDIGIYYDAARESRLERLIAEAAARPSPAAAAGLARWRGERLTKYNIGADRAPDALTGKIILVDQVRGDASVAGAGADAASFERLVARALAAHNAARLAVLTHPDVRAGKARGYLSEIAARHGVMVIAQSLSPQAVLDAAAEVWTVSSGLGFEAILRGVPVTAFGLPFYAGWGLSSDMAEGPLAAAAHARRSARPCAEALFDAAFLRYARYADPVTQRPLDFFGAADRIVDWRARDQARGAAVTHAFGFSPWKRRAAKLFLGGAQAPVQFHRKASPARLRAVSAAPPARAAVWGMAEKPGFAEALQARGGTLIRVEDGFLRSVGLGSDLLAPGSLVLDDLGLYYDARQESRLERILATDLFEPELTARAAALRQRLVAQAVTKYNLAAAATDLRGAAGGRRVLLVVEQVPGDASLRYGGGDPADGPALLQAVRAENADAFVVYKEHPDLVAGNRRGRAAPAALARHADLVLSRGDMAGLFAQIDGMHVLSSLAGFEALLRGVPVTVWGRPFYAGWGLTLDRLSIARRTRRLTVDELVAGALIVYPLYGDPLTHVPCSVEDFLEALAQLRARGPASPAGGLAGQARRLRRWLGAAARMTRGG